MRASQLSLLALFCGAVVGHGSHGQEPVGEVPLHEQAFVQDTPEELEKKWGFEVSCSFYKSPPPGREHGLEVDDIT